MVAHRCSGRHDRNAGSPATRRRSNTGGGGRG
uniref:Uncharacterized protein n=1 Tax=Setaria viridis TaxID=4556 RepID=A0A4U6VQP0_SETVI|nr:hypothetical protein SEVIR_2G152550v2 [Setaria viridis]